jgi:hypothetical protein
MYNVNQTKARYMFDKDIMKKYNKVLNHLINLEKASINLNEIKPKNGKVLRFVSHLELIVKNLQTFAFYAIISPLRIQLDQTIREAKTFKRIIEAHEMMIDRMYKQLLLGDGVKSISSCLNEIVKIAQYQTDDSLDQVTENQFKAKTDFLRKIMDRLSHTSKNSTISEWMTILSRTMYYSNN